MPSNASTGQRVLLPRGPKPSSLPADSRQLLGRQLLNLARFKDPRVSKRLEDYLIKENDVGMLESILDALDSRAMPSSPLNFNDREATDKVEFAMTALLDLSCIFRCFTMLGSLIVETPLGSKLLQMLIERWFDVTKWMAFLLLHASSTTNGSAFITVCTETLIPIVGRSDSNVHKEELVSLPNTIDLFCLLICQIDARMGKPYCLISVTGQPCIILLLLHHFATSKTGFYSLVERMKSVRQKTRQRIVESLFVRPRALAAAAYEGNILATALSLQYLIQGTIPLHIDPTLRDLLLRSDYHFECAAALSILSEKAMATDGEVWTIIADLTARLIQDLVLKLTPNPSESLPRVVEGGIVQCALRCLPNLAPSSRAFTQLLDGTLSLILPFFTVSKVFRTLEKDYPQALLKHAQRQSQGAKTVCREYQQAFDRSWAVFEGRKNIVVNMCSNLKHSATGSPHQENVKMCSSCHIVSYCSKECQAEDWAAFHWRECRSFTKWYKDRKSNKCWISLATRRNQLRYLEHLANDILPPLGGLSQRDYDKDQPRLITETAANCSSTYNPRSTIALFDFVTFEQFACRTTFPLMMHHNAVWQYVNLAWDPRIQACVKDMEKSPTTFALVEGVFMFNSAYAMFTMAKMQFFPGAPVKEKYKVVNSVFRMGPRSVMEEVWASESRKK